MKTKTKINKWDLVKLKCFLRSKGNLKQNEKTTQRVGEDICKQYYRLGISFQNLQTAHVA